jgi:hypothetical protein
MKARIKITNSTKVKLLFKSAILLLFIAPFVSGAELTAILSSGVEYSNNASQRTTATLDEVTQTLGLDVLLQENRKHFNADASFNLEEVYYYNGVFANQTSFTTGFGLFNLDIIEDFLSWRTSFTRTEVLGSAVDSDTPDNREQRSITRTGPLVSFRLNQNSILSVLTNYILVENSDEVASDTKRINSNINYEYYYNSTTRFSLNGEYDEILDADGQEELKRTNFNVGILKQISHGELNFNVGVTQTRPEQSDSVSGNFFDVRLTRNQMLWHDWVFQYQEDISDSSIGFEAEEASSEDSSEENAGSAATTGLDIVQSRRLNVSMSRLLGLYQYTISGFWSYGTYKVQADDEKSRGLTLSINQNVTQSLRAGFLYEFTLNDFFDRPDIGKEKTGTYRFNGQYTLGVDMSLSAYIQYEGRANSNNQVREYEEMATGITFSWEFL